MHMCKTLDDYEDGFPFKAFITDIGDGKLKEITVTEEAWEYAKQFQHEDNQVITKIIADKCTVEKVL